MSSGAPIETQHRKPAPTPDPLTVTGFFRSYLFTRQNASNNPGAQFNFTPGAKYNTTGVNQLGWEQAIDPHAEYAFPGGWYTGGTYLYGDPCGAVFRGSNVVKGNPSLIDCIRRIFDANAATDAARIAELETTCECLRARLSESDERLRTRSEALSDLQQQYSTKHFELRDSMHNLKIERMHYAGMFADRDIALARAKQLQARIQSLKERLRRYESVGDALATMVIENAETDQGAAPDI